MSAAIVELFGETLQSENGKATVKTAEALKDKVVGIYFSAHWCGPCRGFTPQLAEQYLKLTTGGKPFEIVFCSSDRDQSAFDGYFGEMPWLALPFSDRDRKNALSRKYKVSGIPTLVIVDTDGSLITTKGRRAVTSEPENFPWRPPTFEQALGDVFIQNDGPNVSRADLAGKHIALYFSAHWCPPCRGFTPKLVELYKTMRANRDDQNFEFIFVSSDRDEKSFKEYFAEMPWLALPYSDRTRKNQLSEMFDVSGIPTLVVVGPDGITITKDARGSASADPEGKEFPWIPKPLNNLSAGPGAINDCPALVVLMEKASDETKSATLAALQPIADRIAGDYRKESEMVFLYADAAGQIASRLREMCKLGDAEEGGVAVLITDIPAGGAYYVAPEGFEASKDGFETLIEAFKSKSLERKQLG